MKTLLLLRHGKSSWKESALADHDRPLKKRGQRAAEQIGRLLEEQGLTPDHILTSTAIRARDTASLVAETLKFRGTIDEVSALYQAEPQTFVAVVSHVPKQSDAVLVVGHNPGLEDWLSRLTGYQEPFPTAALAHIVLPIENWLDLTPDTRGELRKVWSPKELADD